MRFSKERIVKVASEGAAKAAPRALATLKEFAGIDCGSRNEEGNRKIVEIIDRLLGEIEGISIGKAHPGKSQRQDYTQRPH